MKRYSDKIYSIVLCLRCYLNDFFLHIILHLLILISTVFVIFSCEYIYIYLYMSIKWLVIICFMIFCHLNILCFIYLFFFWWIFPFSFHLLSGVGQRKEEENYSTAQYELFSPPLPMPDNLLIGTSLFFQKTNTFPCRERGRTVALASLRKELGGLIISYTVLLTIPVLQPLLYITASNSWAFLGFWGLRQPASLCVSQYRQKCTLCFCFLFSLLLEVISNGETETSPFFLPEVRLPYSQ